MGTGEGTDVNVVVVWGDSPGGEPLVSHLRDTVGSAVDVRYGCENVPQPITEGRVDCIVIDHKPPVIDGIELIEAIRNVDPNVPIILSPAPDTEEIATEAVEADVSGYVPRQPGTPGTARVAEVVQETLETRTDRRERAIAAGRFGALTENLGDAVIAIDADSTIQYANPALAEVLGYEPCEVRGECLTTLLPKRFRDRHLRALGQYLDSGKRSFDWRGIEFPALHASGHEVPVEVSFGEFTHGGKRFFVGSIRKRRAD